jgi:hypothetical protein
MGAMNPLVTIKTDVFKPLPCELQKTIYYD